VMEQFISWSSALENPKADLSPLSALCKLIKEGGFGNVAACLRLAILWTTRKKMERGKNLRNFSSPYSSLNK
jgi:hypothetical protein